MTAVDRRSENGQKRDRARSAPTSRRRSCRSASRRATRRRTNNIGAIASKSWLKRALPIVLAHKWIFISSLVSRSSA